MRTFRSLLAGLGFILLAASAPAALVTYNGNGVGGSEIVSSGSLTLSGTPGSSISGTFTRGGTDSATMNYYLVLFLDTTAGGFNNTASFMDSRIGAPAAMSGYSGGGRSVATFASGFYADYALVINPDVGVALYHLGTDQHEFLRTLRTGTGQNRDRTYSFNLSRADVGLGATDTLRFESGYITSFGSRTTESFERFSSFGGNWGPCTYEFFDSFDVQPVPEMTRAALPIFGGFLLLAGLGVSARRWWGQSHYSGAQGK